MKYNLLAIFVLLFGLQVAAQNTNSETKKGYNIKLDIPSAKGKMAYWANYSDGNVFAIDSIQLSNAGTGVLSSEKILRQGQYMLFVRPSIQLDILIGDDKQDISIYIDPTDIKKCRITNSKDTELLWEYLEKLKQYNTLTDSLNVKMKAENDFASASALEKRIQKEDNSFDKFVNNIINKNKGTWFATFTKGLQQIKLPYPNPISNNEYYKNRHYLVKHLLDNIDFGDSRIWTANYLEPKLEEYIRQNISEHPDTLAVAASKLVTKYEDNPIAFENVLSYFVNKAQKSKSMGLENTWVRLFVDHIKDKSISWIDSIQVDQLLSNYELVKNNLIGMKAQNLNLQTIDGDTINTDEIEAEYLLLYFYDTNCGHCITETPKLLDIYKAYKDKGFKVLAFNVQASKEHTEYWRSYVEKTGTKDWYNCSDLNHKSEYWIKYNVTGTPSIYLLDKDKVIIAKGIQHESLNTLLEFYIKE